jgi:hypothetical protein
MSRSVGEACVVSDPDLAASIPRRRCEHLPPPLNARVADDVEWHVHQEVEPFEGAEQWRAAYNARQPERHARAHKTELADGAGSDGTRD